MVIPSEKSWRKIPQFSWLGLFMEITVMIRYLKAFIFLAIISILVEFFKFENSIVFLGFNKFLRHLQRIINPRDLDFPTNKHMSRKMKERKANLTAQLFVKILTVYRPRIHRRSSEWGTGGSNYEETSEGRRTCSLQCGIHSQSFQTHSSWHKTPQFNA